MTFEVQLAIYDLSNGMARGLSAQFLGPQYAIDIIPHTGLVVYGREYFFGAGIQSEDPSAFRRNTGMFPIQVRSLGRTSTNRVEFERWCVRAMETGAYSAAAYDLLSRNCNNFCHDAALEGLRLSEGVPEWVLDVPRRFLTSPMGQMVRPMLQNMQVTGDAGAEPVIAATSPPLANAAPSLDVGASTNPWENNTSTQVSSGTAIDTPTEVAAGGNKVKTPLLDTFTKPLFSNDKKTVSLCVKRLIAGAESDTEREALNEADKILPGSGDLTADLTDKIAAVISRSLNRGNNVAFALMLLRIVALKSPTPTEGSIRDCFTWLQTALQSSETLNTPAARSMAWLSVSNAIGMHVFAPSELETYVHAAVRDISIESQPRPEIRQAASAALYNASLTPIVRQGKPGELDDAPVAILCACLEGIDSETDATTKLRRLMAAARIIQPMGLSSVNIAANDLLVDLGFRDALTQIASGSKGKGDATKCQELAAEVLGLLDG